MSPDCHFSAVRSRAIYSSQSRCLARLCSCLHFPGCAELPVTTSPLRKFGLTVGTHPRLSSLARSEDGSNPEAVRSKDQRVCNLRLRLRRISSHTSTPPATPPRSHPKCCRRTVPISPTICGPNHSVSKESARKRTHL